MTPPKQSSVSSPSPEALDARIASLRQELQELDHFHGLHFAGINASVPSGPNTVQIPVGADIWRKKKAAAKLRSEYFFLDVELHDLLAQRAEINREAWEARAALCSVAEIAAAHAESVRLKQLYEDARGHAWRRRQDAETAAQRIGEYARQIREAQAEAERSRKEAAKYSAHYERLTPYADPAAA